jgi:hypothetical protein
MQWQPSTRPSSGNVYGIGVLVDQSAASSAASRSYQSDPLKGTPQTLNVLALSEAGVSGRVEPRPPGCDADRGPGLGGSGGGGRAPDTRDTGHRIGGGCGPCNSSQHPQTASDPAQLDRTTTTCRVRLTRVPGWMIAHPGGIVAR